MIFSFCAGIRQHPTSNITIIFHLISPLFRIILIKINMNDTQNKCIEMVPLRRPLILVSCSKQSRRSHWLNKNDSNESTQKVRNRTGNLNDSVIEEYFFANKDLKISSHQPVQEEHKEAEDWVMITKDETRNGK